MTIEKQIESINNTVRAIYNKLMGKKILYSLPKRSSVHCTINHTYSTNSFEYSSFDYLNNTLLSKKEWKKLLSKKSWKKLAKVLHKYHDYTNKFFLFTSPSKHEEVKQACEDSKQFKITREEFHFYKRKDGNGWTDSFGMADEKLGKFCRVTIKLTPETKMKLDRINEYELLSLGILLSVCVQLWVDLLKQ